MPASALPAWIITTTLAAACLLGLPAAAQEMYRRPSRDIVAILEAKPLPAVSIDPERRFMLLMERRPMPSLADLARPMLRLAGRRIDPGANGPHPRSTIVGLRLRSMADGTERAIEVPADGRIGNVSWSPDGSRFAFTVTYDDGIELWVGDVASATARAMTGRTVNGIAGSYTWMPDGTRLLVHFVDPARGAPPQSDPVPPGPVIQESSGKTSPVRTYQDLLSDTHDEALFEHHFRSQLHLVDVEDGDLGSIGPAQIYRAASPSPDGRYILHVPILTPYSYMVPMWSFAHDVRVWDLETGGMRRLGSQPVADEVPIEGVITGPRAHAWRSTMGPPALVWAEALDEGDPKNEVPHRDKVMMLEDVFDGKAVEIARLEDRYSGMTWIEGTTLALISEYDRDERWARAWLLDVGSDAPPRLVFDRSVQDRYGDPGRPVTTTNAAGRRVVRLDDGHIYLSGRGASPEGDRPFLDRMSLETLETERLWRADGASYESLVDLLSGDEILTRYETSTEPPNYYVRNLADGTRTAVTSFAHPAPALRDVRKELVTYRRADGVELSATLYLPPKYDEQADGPLPLVVWAYPREFNDPSMAGQISGSPHRFTYLRGSSHLFLLLAGYAILDGATMPIVGSDPETVNDTFLEQAVASAGAAIDYAAKRGVADPDRVGVGGHSYGAFMTANLLAHSDLFRAGIARSGAYNRTLTPFGFQSERRTFWEAPEVYFELSPFMHADQIGEPLLLIHGQADNNSGTFPIQSQRLYHAVKGHGGTVRLVMLPHESHGYRSEESVMHVVAEMVDWFDRYVKSGPVIEGAGAPGTR